GPDRFKPDAQDLGRVWCNRGPLSSWHRPRNSRPILGGERRRALVHSPKTRCTMIEPVTRPATARHATDKQTTGRQASARPATARAGATQTARTPATERAPATPAAGTPAAEWPAAEAPAAEARAGERGPLRDAPGNRRFYKALLARDSAFDGVF